MDGIRIRIKSNRQSKRSTPRRRRPRGEINLHKWQTRGDKFPLKVFTAEGDVWLFGLIGPSSRVGRREILGKTVQNKVGRNKYCRNLGTNCRYALDLTCVEPVCCLCGRADDERFETMLGVTSTSSGGRFVDDVASVPIKKRRITMVRSPSPPPEDAVANSNFSEIPGLPPADAAAPTGKPGSVAHFLEDGMSSAEFPRPEVGKPPFERLNDGGLIDSLENQQKGQWVRVTQTEEDCEKQADMLKNAHVMKVDVTPYSLNEPEGHVNATCEEMRESTELALGCQPTNGGFGSQYVQMLACSPEYKGKKEEGLLLRLNSGYFNDNRSHWDLNTPVDSWEKETKFLDADYTGKVATGTSRRKSLENLDGFQVHMLDVEAESKVTNAEEDMLSKGFQADRSARELGFSEGSASEEDAEVDTCIGLQPDTFLSRPRDTSRQQRKHACVPKNDVRFEESVAERGLNLSIAPFEAPSRPSTDVSTMQTEDTKHWGEELPDDNSGTQHQLQSDRRSDTLVNGSEVYAYDNIEYSALKYDVELVKGRFDGVDGLGPKGNSSGTPASNDHLDVVVKNPKSSPAEDQHLIETRDEDRIDEFVSVEDTNTRRERSASPEDLLEQQSTGYASEVAYARDYEYDDEDELISDTEKVAVGWMEDDYQRENEEHRERVDEEEQMEVEDVDYGDFDCRDVDDLSIDPDEGGKGAEFMDPEDARHERDWDDGQQSEMEQKNHVVHHDSQFGEALQVALDVENTKAGETESAVTDMEHSTMKDNKVDSMDSKSTKPLDQNKRMGGEIGLFFNLDQHESGAMSMEGMYPTLSKQKSSGWDQLPEGFKNAEEAFKAVKDIISMQGQRTAWVSHNVRAPGGQMGPIFSRGSFTRMDGRFEERVCTDAIMHGKEKFYTRDGRDGGLCTSPRFASRKPSRGQSIGRNGFSPGLHNSVRGDLCMDSATGHWCPNRHRSPPDHYGDQDGFGPRGSTAAAAKDESNGFVVALDGTLTKVDWGGMHGRRGRGTLMRTAAMDTEEIMNFGMQMGMEPGRAMTVVHERVDTHEHGGRKRYQGPLFVNARRDMLTGDSPRMPMQSMDHQLGERNRSFSPPPRRRLPPHLSRRCSRSRTRSPQLRPSPRGSAVVGIGLRTAPRKYSRSSPALRSEARMKRLKSPLFHHEGSLGHKLSFLPSSGSQRSPPQAPKWFSDKRDVDHLKDSDYKKRFVRARNPSRRLSLHGVHESGLMDSPRRFNRREYCGHMHSSRASEFGSDSRCFKHEENKSIRLKQSDTSGRSAEIGGLDARQFQHQDDDNDCQARRSHGKDAGTSRD